MSITITGIHLRSVAFNEYDTNPLVEVHVEVDGKWQKIIETHGTIISHIAEFGRPAKEHSNGR